MQTTIAPQPQLTSLDMSIRMTVEQKITDEINSLPPVDSLNAEQRRGLIARYTAVLEGNFIYMMTAAYLAARSEEARAQIIDNLYEEVRDSHPVMLRNFAIAAHALPTDGDARAVHAELTRLRLFMGRLASVKILVTMAFFEGFIQQFMAYLAELARIQGSSNFEYTDVHGICDIAHTEGLFQALSMEMDIHKTNSDDGLFEGVGLLGSLLYTIVTGKPSEA